MVCLIVPFIYMHTLTDFACRFSISLVGLSKVREGCQTGHPIRICFDNFKVTRVSVPKDAAKYALKLLSIFYSDE